MVLFSVQRHAAYVKRIMRLTHGNFLTCVTIGALTGLFRALGACALIACQHVLTLC